MSTPLPTPLTPAATINTLSFGGYCEQAAGLQGVGFWPRFSARAIDLVLHFFIGFFVGTTVGLLVAIASGGHASPLLLHKLRQTTLSSLLLAMIGSVAYHTLSEGLHGSSLGKRMLSLVVIQEGGNACGLRQALVRSLAYFIDALFFGLIGYMSMQKTPQQQRYGDEWAHTIVCRRSAVSQDVLRGDGAFFLAITFAIMADAMFLILGMVLKLA